MDRKDIEAQLRQDFLERDGSSFVFERTDNRLGWEKTIPEGSGYSSYITDAKDDEDLMKKAYDLARKTITAMNTPFKVRIRLNPGEKSCSFTDFKQVAVSTSVFDEKDLTIGQKLDTFLGYTVHEGCHLLFTDPTPKASDRLTHAFENIIEDERIEHLCGERTPGLVKFIASAKYHAFDKYVGLVGESQDIISRFVNAVLTLVRYPKAFAEQDIDDFGERLLAVRDILTPYPTSTRGSYEAAKRIVELIRDFIEEARKASEEAASRNESGGGDSGDDAPEETSSESGNSGSGDNEDEDDSSGSGSGSDDDSSESSAGNTSEDASGDSSSEEGTDEDSTGDSGEDSLEDSSSESDRSGIGDTEDEDSSSSFPGSGDPLEGKSVEEIMNALEEAFGELSHEENAVLGDGDASAAVRDDEMLESICEGGVERGVSKDRSFVFQVSREDISRCASKYDTSYDNVRKYIPAVRNILRCNGQELRHNLLGMRSGRFDCNKLAEAYQGSDCVYRQQSVSRADNLAVCILIDESGSMHCSGFGTTASRIDCARDTAVLLYEALRGIPNIDLYVYGHTADIQCHGSVELNVYCEHGRGERKALGACNARADNADGYAILEAAARVRRYTSDKCLMFVISDGAPAACCYSWDGETHTRSCVQQITRQGFSPVQISIGGDDPSSMFDHYVMCDDLSRLPLELGKLVKKAILKNS